MTQPLSIPGGGALGSATGPAPYVDDYEYGNSSGKEQFLRIAKWVVIAVGFSAALYFGGGVLLNYFKTESQADALVRNNQEVVVLREEIEKLRNAGSSKFQVEIKAVEKSPTGFAYLVVDSFQQPWFIQSDQVLKKGGKVWVSIEPASHEGNPPNVRLTLSSEGTHDSLPQKIKTPPAHSEPPSTEAPRHSH
jgi:hypothetical protein